MRKLLIMAALVALFIAATAAYATTLNLIEGTEHYDNITGTQAGDLIKVYGSTDTVNGRGGNDVIWGGASDDFLRGAGGNDQIHGGPDEQGPKTTDQFRCGRGEDTVFGKQSEKSDLSPTCENFVREK